MTTRRLSLSQFQRWVLTATPELEKAAVKGMRAAALRLNRAVVLEIGQAEPRPAVDTGELRNSVNVTAVPDGAIVSVDAPHAGIIEYGRRPGRKPPLEPLMDWVLRHPELLPKDVIKAASAARRRRIARHVKLAAPVVGRAYARRAIRATTESAREIAARSVAFAIQKSIAQKGIAPRHYFAKAWQRSENDMVLELLHEIAKTGWTPTAQGRSAIKAMFNGAKQAGGGAA